MDVWMTWCRRKAVCKYCGEDIVKATPIVKCKSVRGNTTKLTTMMYFHPKCWVENGMDYLEKNPYTSGMRGRKRLELSDEDRRARYLLLRKYAGLKQRLGNIVTKFPDNLEPTLRIEEQMRQIMVDISVVGGIPPKWLEQIDVTNHQ